MIERISPPGVARPARPLFPGRSRRRFHLRFRPGPHRSRHPTTGLRRYRDETRQTLTNIKRILEGCGATLATW
jgi:hypothetical protein